MSDLIHVFRSTDQGAPELHGTLGQQVALLDALFLNGYNQQTLTGINVASGVATATLTSHGYVTDQVLRITGATPAALNTDVKITVTGSDTFTFTTTAADGAATGTIDAVVAPMDYVKTYSATNRAAYQRTALEAVSGFLYVDDNRTEEPRVCHVYGYANMTDIDAGTGRFPNTSVVDGTRNYWWEKSNVTDTSTRLWWAVGNDRAFYWQPSIHGNYQALSTSSFGVWPYFFGDVLPMDPLDTSNLLLVGTRGTSYSFSYPGVKSVFHGDESGGYYGGFKTGSKGTAGAKSFPGHIHNTDAPGSWGEYTQYDYAAGDPLLYDLCGVGEQDDNKEFLRGHLPGAYYPLHARPLFTYHNIYQGSNINPTHVLSGLEGRNLMQSRWIRWSTHREVYLDITGPWDY